MSSHLEAPNFREIKIKLFKLFSTRKSVLINNMCTKNKILKNDFTSIEEEKLRWLGYVRKIVIRRLLMLMN